MLKTIDLASKNQQIGTFKAYNKDLDLYFYGISVPIEGGSFVIFRENTKDQKSKIKLQDSENKLKAILDSTPDCIVLIDRNFKVLAMNKVAVEFCLDAHKKTMNEGDDFRSFIFMEIAGEFHHLFSKALKGGISKFEKEVEVSSKKKK
ncbi:hypothetical protein [Belliella baltica]|uniref:hypothetical protein n=1 Tax=Belliella baltica TaxID=232259 RepID=UPI0012FC8E15|nr:hypothetical protein [Belliella baltica]